MKDKILTAASYAIGASPIIMGLCDDRIRPAILVLGVLASAAKLADLYMNGFRRR